MSAKQFKNVVPISVTLPKSLTSRVRKAAEGRTLSAFITEMLEKMFNQEDESFAPDHISYRLNGEMDLALCRIAEIGPEKIISVSVSDGFVHIFYWSPL